MFYTTHPTLSTLTSTAIDALAHLLTLSPALLSPTTGTPSPLWLEAQSHAPTTLPDVLRAPSRRSSLLARLLHPGRHEIQKARLCEAHGGLNKWLVRDVVVLVGEEVGMRLEGVREWVEGAKEGRYDGLEEKWDGKEEGALDEVEALMGRVEYLWEVLGGENRGNLGGGCEACILAIVGGDASVLLDLRALLRGRMHKRKREPALMKLVEAWVCALGDETERVKRESKALGRIINRAKRAVWKFTHERSRAGKHGTHHHHQRRRHKYGRSTKKHRVQSRSRRSDSGYGSSAAVSGGDGELEGSREKQRRFSEGEESGGRKRWADQHPLRALSSSSHRCGGAVCRHSRILSFEDHTKTASDPADARISATASKHHRFSTTDTVAGVVDGCQTDGRESSEDEELQSHQRLRHHTGSWYDRRRTDDETIHPALRTAVTTSIHDKADQEQQEDVSSVQRSPPQLSQEQLVAKWNLENERLEEEDYADVTKWTDVSVRSPWSEGPPSWDIQICGSNNQININNQTLASGPGTTSVPMYRQSAQTLLSSSSVYSTDGAGVPHPALSVASSSASTITPATYLRGGPPAALRLLEASRMATVAEGMELIAPASRSSRFSSCSDEEASSVSSADSAASSHETTAIIVVDRGSRKGRSTEKEDGIGRRSSRLKRTSSSAASSSQAQSSYSSLAFQTELDRRRTLERDGEESSSSSSSSSEEDTGVSGKKKVLPHPSFPFVDCAQARRQVSLLWVTRTPPRVCLVSREVGSGMVMEGGENVGTGMEEEEEVEVVVMHEMEDESEKEIEKERARKANVRSRIMAIETAERSRATGWSVKER